MSEEIFPIVNDEGKVIGKETRAVCHGGSMLLHPVVHVHIFNSKGDIYIQKRNLTKDIQPGKWDTAVGGHVDFGETVEVAVKRECFEELGLKDVQPVFAYTYQWHSTIESELVYVHTLIYDGEITPNADELMDGRFWTIAEVKNSLGKSIFTPNFEHDFQLLIDYKVVDC
jgi:isopentenyldiphosphate isomerase